MSGTRHERETAHCREAAACAAANKGKGGGTWRKPAPTPQVAQLDALRLAVGGGHAAVELAHRPQVVPQPLRQAAVGRRLLAGFGSRRRGGRRGQAVLAVARKTAALPPGRQGPPCKRWQKPAPPRPSTRLRHLRQQPVGVHRGGPALGQLGGLAQGLVRAGRDAGRKVSNGGSSGFQGQAGCAAGPPPSQPAAGAARRNRRCRPEMHSSTPHFKTSPRAPGPPSRSLSEPCPG